MTATLLDVQAVRRRFSSLQGDFVFLDAPGGSQVPDEVGDAIARALRDASANIGANYETSKRVEHDPGDRAGRRRPVPQLLAGRRDLRHEHDRARLHALAHRVARLEGGRPDPRLAPRPRRRRRAVDRARGRPRLRGRLDRRHRGSAARPRRSRAEARRARARRRVRRVVERRRHDRRPPSRRRARALRRRARVGRRGAVRRARAGRRAGARLRRLHRVGIQVLRPASRRRVRTARAARVVAAVQGAARAVRAGRAAVRAGHGAVRAARRLLRDDRVPRVARRHAGARARTSASSAGASSRACRRA